MILLLVSPVEAFEGDEMSRSAPSGEADPATFIGRSPSPTVTWTAQLVETGVDLQTIEPLRMMNDAFDIEEIGMMQLAMLTAEQTYSDHLLPCQQHPDDRVHWDRRELFRKVGPARQRAQAWTTTIDFDHGMQTMVHEFFLDTISCLRCTLERHPNLREMLRSPQVCGPYLVRPSPLDATLPWAPQFIVLTESKPHGWMAFLVHYYYHDQVSRGTLLVPHMANVIRMTELFDRAKPQHRCRQTAWCRVRARTEIYWWSDTIAVTDFMLLHLDEIDPPQAEVISSSEASTQCPLDSGMSVHSSAESTVLSSNFPEEVTHLMQTSTS